MMTPNSVSMNQKHSNNSSNSSSCNNNNNNSSNVVVVLHDESSADENHLNIVTTEASSPETKRTTTIAKKETMHVNAIKMFLFVFLIVATIGVAIAVYMYSSQSETKNFEEQFYDDASKILESVGSTFERALGAVDAFAVSVVSNARRSNQTWPFVTIPDFAIRAAKIRTGILQYGIFLQPLVTPEQRKEWEQYAWDNQGWVNESMKLQEYDKNFFGPLVHSERNDKSIFGNDGNIPYNSTRLMMPTWQTYPAVQRYYPAFNWDWLSALETTAIEAAVTKRKAAISRVLMLPDLNDPAEVEESKVFAEWYKDYIRADEESNAPSSDLHYPLIDQLHSIETIANATTTASNSSQYKVVGTIATSFYWREVIRYVLPRGRRGILVVFNCTCNPSFTYQVNGPETVFIGRGDHHNPKFDNLKVSGNFFDLGKLSGKASEYYGVPLDGDNCPVELHLYPTDEMKNDFTSNAPTVFAIAAVAIFGLTSIAFCVYDCKVQKRQNVVLKRAEEDGAIVSSLFPSNIRNKLSEHNNANNINNNDTTTTTTSSSSTKTLYNNENSGKKNTPFLYESKPLADLYPDTTVFFADIAGFTAWSSVRDPCQVFTLLETLFGSIDKIAATLRIFKVETIGDCYVAVCGLPERNMNHAVVMCRFARICMEQLPKLLEWLEQSLGPGTENLQFRIGLNSGPTTAGVLRGEKSRYQLFGDTVNTAARMESTGIPGKVQLSQKTADLLMEAGKGSWITEREDTVFIKGKGIMKTFWLLPKSGRNVSEGNRSADDYSQKERQYDDGKDFQQTNLVEYTVGVFTRLLHAVIQSHHDDTEESTLTPGWNNIQIASNRVPLDEYSEVIEMPTYDPNRTEVVDADNARATTATVSQNVTKQLHDYIVAIAYMYKDHSFHNFEHACHVLMSTTKLLQRMEKTRSSTNHNQAQSCDVDSKKFNIRIQKLTPLTELAIAFAALILDVDHTGLTNAQLVKQWYTICQLYNGQCVAEQNSFDVAWKLLMQPNFKDLQNCMFHNDIEVKHFRQVVINCILATDVFDTTLKPIRDLRWERTFGNEKITTAVVHDESSSYDDILRRKTTIIIEHIIVTSDVVHTMQHWHIYQKWNHKLFHEMYYAFCQGRTNQNPADVWYENELKFFDEYIIPLARNIKVCGAFGVSGDEFLDFALDNRREWENKGQDITRTLTDLAGRCWDAE